MLKKYLALSLMTVSLLFMSGCGGGGGAESLSTGGETSASSDLLIASKNDSSQLSASAATVGVGTYVDAPVVGLRYRCGEEEGTTDKNGHFRFELGKSCDFYLGNVHLRTVGADRLFDGVIFVEDNAVIAALLQSMDEEAGDEVITIPEEVAETLDEMAVTEIPEDSIGLALLVKEMKRKNPHLALRVVSFEEAEAHLERSKEKLVEKVESAEKIVMASEIEAQEGVALREDPIAPITDEFFDRLDETERLYIAKKLYATLFKGKGLPELRREVNSGTFISDFKKMLETEVPQPDADKIIEPNEELFSDSTGGGDALTRKKGEADEVIISHMIYTKLGKSYYSDWMAFKLNQTILFSPGWEVDTMVYYPRFILNIFDRLRTGIKADRPIREIVKEHMVSKENWARFRSPEDNGREMLEIWLYDFNDSHVPLAAKALKNWKFYTYYERPFDKYMFVNGVGDEENNETVYLLGRALKTGEDFFDAVIEHKDFIPTVVDRIVGRFFPTFAPEKRAKITEAIVANNPKTFKEIFDAILFSKTYLFESDKVKTVEETVYSLYDTLDFRMGRYTIPSLINAFRKMNQKINTYKLGREDKVPVDTVSMSQYVKFVKEKILDNRDESDRYPEDNGIDFKKISQRYDKSDTEAFLNDIFLDLLGRKAMPLELETLIDHFDKTKIGYPKVPLSDVTNETSRVYMTWITYVYISGLTELYQYRNLVYGE